MRWCASESSVIALQAARSASICRLDEFAHAFILQHINLNGAGVQPAFRAANPLIDG